MADTFPVETEVSTPAQPEQTYTRFSLSQRIEHLLLLVTFTTLGITGLAQKFSDSPVGAGIIALLGGILSSRLIHRTAAVLLMAVSIYHIVAALYRLMVKRHALSMLPSIQDFQHVYQDVMYYIGKRARRAYYGRYSYAEKAEYLAVVWGTVIMAITGFMMWNPLATTRFLPGEAIPAAKAAHGGEALLAVLAIILWHFYHVHLRHFNKSMFTGKMTEAEMLHEHPAELSEIKAGRRPQEIAPEQRRKRERVFFPIAAVIVAVLSYGLYRFVTLEDTAIIVAANLGETAPVFVPFTPTPTPNATPTSLPTPTPEVAAVTATPSQATSWTGAIGPLLMEKCAACHGEGGLGGLNLTTYEGALEGGNRGPAVVPGDPAASILVQIQEAGGHPGQLTEAELGAVIDWIEAGAPEG